MAAEVGMGPDHFEIRFMREPLGLKNFAVTYERFGGGWRAPLGHAHRRGHRHKVQEEVYFLISGRAGCARTGILELAISAGSALEPKAGFDHSLGRCDV